MGNSERDDLGLVPLHGGSRTSWGTDVRARERDVHGKRQGKEQSVIFSEKN